MIPRKLLCLKNHVGLPVICTLIIVTGCRNTQQAPHSQDLLTDRFRTSGRLLQWQLLKSDTTNTYVADPKHWWSKHCSGRAVDVTLIELKTGAELKMPSAFDDFSTKASSDYEGPDMQVAENLHLLQSTMHKAGFIGIRKELWHYANATHFSQNIAPIPAKEAGIELSHPEGPS